MAGLLDVRPGLSMTDGTDIPVVDTELSCQRRAGHQSIVQASPDLSYVIFSQFCAMSPTSRYRCSERLRTLAVPRIVATTTKPADLERLAVVGVGSGDLSPTTPAFLANGRTNQSSLLQRSTDRYRRSNRHPDALGIVETPPAGVLGQPVRVPGPPSYITVSHRPPSSNAGSSLFYQIGGGRHR
jgi:hypothetical protein